MSRSRRPPLSRRERQILDILYRLGRATAGTVRAELEDAPSYSAVRALLRVLEEKGHVQHTQDGPRYVYAPRVPRERARRSALEQVVTTFYGDSPASAVAALLDMSGSEISPEELDRLSQMIDAARKEGR